jgi:predicted nucleotide-binding protein
VTACLPRWRLTGHIPLAGLRSVARATRLGAPPSSPTREVGHAMANGTSVPPQGVPPSKVIFVASSNEARSRAQILVEALKKAGLSPLPWWDRAVFRGGDYTFPRLIAVAQSVDAAIFLATRDDKLWFRGTESDAPRDNIVLEMGVFASRLGVKRSLLLAEPGSKLPSDLAGLTHAVVEGIEAAAAQAIDDLRFEFERPRPVLPITIL